ncbi:MAG: hypothetical protein ACRD4M_13655, partial [Candidatus Acidiferrales bacterium]
MSFRTRATATVFCVVALVFATQAQTQAPVQAQTPAPAQSPVQTSTPATAQSPADEFNALLERAAAGDAQAQFALGDDYYRGAGVPQDYGQALVWFRKSTAQGY